MFKSKNISITVVLLIVITIATACSNQNSGTDIIDVTWQWAELVENEPASQSIVPTPKNYTLLFNADETMNIQADCNMVSGSYKVEGNSLTLELGPSTIAFCGEESLDVMFTGFLNKVESFVIENDQMVLNLKNNAGKMTFNR